VMGRAIAVDAPKLIDARGVMLRSETGPQKMACHDEPRLLVVGGLDARVEALVQGGPEGANQEAIPPALRQAEDFLEMLEQVVGRAFFVAANLTAEV